MKKTVAKKPISQEEILDAIRAEAKRSRSGRIRMNAFVAKTSIKPADIYTHFPSWFGALTAAGLDYRLLKITADTGDLLADWGAVARKLQRPAPYEVYNQFGKYSATTFQHRFGSWSRVSNAFRAFAFGKPEWADVLKLCPAQTRFTRSRSNSDGRAPRLMRQRSAPVAPRDDRPTFGEPIHGVPGLLNAPVNEAGVIVIFGILAHHLGFQIRAIRSAFPDCLAMRSVGRGAWQEVRIEFEFESRNFRDHRHPPEGCDIIVCWTRNWEDCPPNLEVIALSEELERLREIAE